MLIKKLTVFIKDSISDAVKILTTREGVKSLYHVSLYRNATYLLLDSAITALGGFVFWVIAARFYTTESLGLASAAIAAVGLISSISGLGLSFAVIRFLPGSGDRARKIINSCLTVGGLVSLVLAIIFLAELDLWSPALMRVRDNTLYSILFVTFVWANTLFSFTKVVFVAQRRSGLVLSQGLIANVIRFIPLVALATVFATFGIFVSWGIAILAAGVIAILFLLPSAQKGYRPFPTINRKIISEMINFSLSNYLVGLLAMASSSILPLMVINILGAEQNAYFTISWLIGTTIATVPAAITTSLFAEGSHDEKVLGNQVKRSLKFILLLLTPVIIIILLFGNWLLQLLRPEYAQNAATLLHVLTITALPLSINSLYFTVKRVQKEMKSVVIMNAFISVVTLGVSYFLLPRMGVLATGIGWLSANGIVALLVVASWIRKQTSPALVRYL